MTYPGLEYRKFDLHVHTPESPCFGDKAVTAQQIVERALEAGLDGVAITDHNSGRFVDAVKTAAKGTGLTVFPGAEIHASGGKTGIHVIALLDPSKGTADIASLLSKVGLSPDQYGKPDAVAKSVEEVVAEIESFGGIAVLAHVNSSKGAMSDMQGAQRTQLFSMDAIRAVEATSSDFAKPEGQRVVDRLDGTDPTYNNRAIAVYVASDSLELDGAGVPTGRHCLASIGATYSYFKTEADPTIESLKQCFIDPQVRIRLPKGIAASTPDDIEAYPRIVSVSANDGFLKDQEFVFHPGLNTVVGPKGSGKSMLVELMRFAMDRRSGLKHVDEDHRSKLSKRLGLHGAVTVRVCDRTGTVQEVRREYAPDDGDPFAKPTMIDLARDFGILFLSQGEMVRVAEDPASQMAFLDGFFDFRSFIDRIGTLETELAVLDKQLASAIRDQKAVGAAERRVQALTDRIKQLDETVKDPIFRDYYTEKQRLDFATRVLDDVNATVTLLEKSSSEMLPFAPPAIPDALAKDPSLKRLVGVAEDSRSKAIKALKDAFGEAQGDLAKAKTERDAILADFQAAKAKYIERARELGGNQQALSAERETKQGDLETEERKLGRLKQSGSTLVEIATARNAKLTELDGVYKEYTDARRALSARITSDSDGKVRVTVAEQGNRAEFAERLGALKVGSYIATLDINAIVAAVTPKALVGAILNFDLKTANRDASLQGIADAANLDVQTVRKLAEHVLASYQYEEILAFQYSANPGDAPLIEVSVGDGVYAPLDEVSTGQKCTGLIVIALSATDGPVVIDQPEDSLDITGIWDDMCQTLRRGKDHQQFILTSHSSNLAVASDTDNYSVLAADATSARIVKTGALDGSEVRVEVLNVLEGGSRAYDLKSKKYGLSVKRKGE